MLQVCVTVDAWGTITLKLAKHLLPFRVLRNDVTHTLPAVSIQRFIVISTNDTGSYTVVIYLYIYRERERERETDRETDRQTDRQTEL